MAGHVTPRGFLVCAIPTLIAILSLIWYRKRKKKLEESKCSNETRSEKFNSFDSTCCNSGSKSFSDVITEEKVFSLGQDSEAFVAEKVEAVQLEVSSQQDISVSSVKKVSDAIFITEPFKVLNAADQPSYMHNLQCKEIPKGESHEAVGNIVKESCLQDFSSLKSVDERQLLNEEDNQLLKDSSQVEVLSADNKEDIAEDFSHTNLEECSSIQINSETKEMHPENRYLNEVNETIYESSVLLSSSSHIIKEPSLSSSESSTLEDSQINFNTTSTTGLTDISSSREDSLQTTCTSVEALSSVLGTDDTEEKCSNKNDFSETNIDSQNCDPLKQLVEEVVETLSSELSSESLYQSTSSITLSKESDSGIGIDQKVEESQDMQLEHDSSVAASESPLQINENSEIKDKGKDCMYHTPVVVHSFPSESQNVEVTDSPPQGSYSDVHSEGSSDSGKGGSDIQFGGDILQCTNSDVKIYEFELPYDLCGRLIGRQGKQVKYIKDCSNANVFIKRHSFNPRFKLCTIEGTQTEIQNALDLIRKRFPLTQYPMVTLAQVNISTTCGVPIPETLQLHLPEGITCDVILSSMVTAGHFFLQQPTHPTYPSLSSLDQCMFACYSRMDTPQLPKPVEPGIICAATVMGGWYRAQVMYIHENLEECDIKFVDYGGYSQVPISSLRQIRSDFMTLPFQASECYLANVKPVDEEAGWTIEACGTFEELAQGQILQSIIVAYAEDGIPYVHLYKVQGVSNVFINRELVSRGVAHWVEHQY